VLDVFGRGAACPWAIRFASPAHRRNPQRRRFTNPAHRRPYHPDKHPALRRRPPRLLKTGRSARRLLTDLPESREGKTTIGSLKEPAGISEIVFDFKQLGGRLGRTGSSNFRDEKRRSAAEFAVARPCVYALKNQPKALSTHTQTIWEDGLPQGPRRSWPPTPALLPAARGEGGTREEGVRGGARR